MNAEKDKKASETPVLPVLMRQRLAEQIAELLRQQIIMGDLKPGTAIHERETSEALGVSRTPLREALLILEADGLIVINPSRSPVIVDPSLKEITDMLHVQSALESLAGEIACDVISETELSELEEIHSRLEKLSVEQNKIEFFQKDMEFHTTLVSATGNLALIRTHRQYHTRLWRARYMVSIQKVNRKLTLEDHRSILDNLRSRKKALVSETLKNHLGRAITKVTALHKDQKS